MECSNSFAALALEDPDVPDPIVNTEPDVPDPSVNLTAAFSTPRRCCISSTLLCRDFPFKKSEGSVEQLVVHIDEAWSAETRHRTYRPKMGVRPFVEKRLDAILGSWASVLVVPPHARREYPVVPGEAALAGVRYEIADGNNILNLARSRCPR